jgi:hypothetical protein
MTPRWRLAYSYAKTSGRLSKSFLGPRLKLIAECENVHDLYAPYSEARRRSSPFLTSSTKPAGP